MIELKRHRPRGINSRIRTMMQIRDLTIDQVAKDCLLSRAMIADFTTGNASPGEAAIYQLAKGLRCSVLWLREGVLPA